MLLIRSLSSVVLSAFILTSVTGNAWAAWPFGEKKTETQEQQAVPKKTATSTTKSITASASKPSARSTAAAQPQSENAVQNPAGMPNLPKTYQAPKFETGVPSKRELGLPEIPTSKAIERRAKPAAVSVPGQEDPELARVQQQIKEIIKINESLKSDYSEQAAQIQKISEQAKIHEKILSDLEESKNLSARPSDTYLNEEKVRLIQQETAENRKLLQTIQNQNPVNETNTSNAPAPSPNS